MREHEAILDALRRRAPHELSDILFIHLRNKLIAVVEKSADGDLSLAKPQAEKKRS
jgi:DNA-binding GntR family transcriptional regulator